ncbi:hypothetical protein [Oleidesulfovibrio sp.]|uniref:hypothetical protein n=1 Tax=Oleidesulfovibrio sp. TaxID=2909707 RepID=UPI003A8B3D04
MSNESNKPLAPVKPIALELLLFYPCPFCDHKMPMLNPVKPTVARCDSCLNAFPVVPVDARTLSFLKVMLDNGRASIDPDFM